MKCKNCDVEMEELGAWPSGDLTITENVYQCRQCKEQVRVPTGNILMLELDGTLLEVPIEVKS